MSTMISEVYDALRDAGASEDKARKAAEAIAGYENRFAKIENDITAFRAEVRGDMALLKGDMALLKWMLSFVLAFVVALMFKAFA